MRFACTACGACCNRSPEVELSEAAALADVFVFRLMFRLYQLPRAFAGHPESGGAGAGASEAFYQSKRLLARFAARKYPARRRQNGKTIEFTNYLTISALTLDTGAGACTALDAGRCAIYGRRPLACRTVPLHYARPEALAEADLAAFVATPFYRCDTSAAAPVVVEEGRIVDGEARLARGEALALADADRGWKEAIVRGMKVAGSGLPSLHEIEAGAQFGATTVSMRLAWQVAAEAGLIGGDTYRALIAAQLVVIERDLAAPCCAAEARETLTQMRAEYLSGSR